MNKIEELIQQLCPDGVAFKELGEVCNFLNGKGHEKHIVENGRFIVVNSKFISTEGNVKKYCDSQISPVYKDDVLMVMSDLPNGKALAKCFIVDEDNKYTLNQRICALIVKNIQKLNGRFLYYMANRNAQLLKFDNSVDQTNLRKDNVLSILIPIPPLEIQEEIVTILDKFTQLEAELEAELEARKKQYEYYRNELLNFEGKEVELGEVCLKPENIKWKENQNIDFQYIDLSSVSRETNKISETQTINSSNAPSRAQQIVKMDDVVFGTTRPTLKRYSLITSKYDNQICSTGFCVLRANQKELLPKFLFFILTTTGFYNYVENKQEGAGYPSISNSVVKKFKIPIPPIAEQERIVEVLDKFDALVNDISVGLPAEIQARRKQYEYYRGKLLNFKPLHNDNRPVTK